MLSAAACRLRATGKSLCFRARAISGSFDSATVGPPTERKKRADKSRPHPPRAGRIQFRGRFGDRARMGVVSASTPGSRSRIIGSNTGRRQPEAHGAIFSGGGHGLTPIVPRVSDEKGGSFCEPPGVDVSFPARAIFKITGPSRNRRAINRAAHAGS